MTLWRTNSPSSEESTHWLLGGWHSRGQIVHHQRNQHVSFGSNEPVIMMFPMKFGYIILKYDGQRDSVKTSIIEAVLFCFEVFRRYVVLWSVPTVCCVFHFITNYYYVSSRVCGNGLRQWLVWCYCSGVNEAVLSLKRFHIFLSKISV